jgi:hypothetical protein
MPEAGPSLFDPDDLRASPPAELRAALVRALAPFLGDRTDPRRPRAYVVQEALDEVRGAIREYRAAEKWRAPGGRR